MIFLKFLDDYQRDDDENQIEIFPLFAQRLNERRQRRSNDSSTTNIPPFHRFRRTIDLLENQMKQTSKQSNSSFSKFLKNIFEKEYN